MAGEYLNPMEIGFKPQPKPLPQNNKNKEALRIINNVGSEMQILQHLMEGNGSGHKINRVLQELRNIKKDISLEPLNHEYCPTCERYIDRCGGLIDDCPYCGQKIDWGDKDEN